MQHICREFTVVELLVLLDGQSRHVGFHGDFVGGFFRRFLARVLRILVFHRCLVGPGIPFRSRRDLHGEVHPGRSTGSQFRNGPRHGLRSLVEGAAVIDLRKFEPQVFLFAGGNHISHHDVLRRSGSTVGDFQFIDNEASLFGHDGICRIRESADTCSAWFVHRLRLVNGHIRQCRFFLDSHFIGRDFFVRIFRVIGVFRCRNVGPVCIHSHCRNTYGPAHGHSFVHANVPNVPGQQILRCIKGSCSLVNQGQFGCSITDRCRHHIGDHHVSGCSGCIARNGCCQVVGDRIARIDRLCLFHIRDGTAVDAHGLVQIQSRSSVEYVGEGESI